ncbi:conserved hypothetical protein [Ricinus communis]|uniref:Uncharacterized protein n=1 Tax=Ricinus communis TaxID=3988 RepID=B9TC57_RICCO|nr:conserved hypothetical protein [Ricinus communis]
MHAKLLERIQRCRRLLEILNHGSLRHLERQTLRRNTALANHARNIRNRIRRANIARRQIKSDTHSRIARAHRCEHLAQQRRRHRMNEIAAFSNLDEKRRRHVTQRRTAPSRKRLIRHDSLVQPSFRARGPRAATPAPPVPTRESAFHAPTRRSSCSRGDTPWRNTTHSPHARTVVRAITPHRDKRRSPAIPTAARSHPATHTAHAASRRSPRRYRAVPAPRARPSPAARTRHRPGAPA